MRWKVTLSGSNPSKKVVKILMELTNLESSEVLLALKKGSLIASSGISKARAEELSASLSKHSGIKCVLLPVDVVDSHPLRFRVVLVECEVGKRSRLRRKLQELAGIHHEQAVLWLSKIPFVIKKHVDNNTARQIKNAITEAGGIVRIEPELGESSDKNESADTPSAVLFEKEEISEVIDEKEKEKEITATVREEVSFTDSSAEEELCDQQIESSELGIEEELPAETDDEINEILVNPEEIIEDIADKDEERQEMVCEGDDKDAEPGDTAERDNTDEEIEIQARTSEEKESEETVPEVENTDIPDDNDNDVDVDEEREASSETEEEFLEMAEGIPKGGAAFTKDFFNPPPKSVRKKRKKDKSRLAIPCIFIPGKPPKSAPPVEFIVPPIFTIEKIVIIAPPVIQMCTPSTNIEYCIPPVLYLEKKKIEVRKTPPPHAIVFSIPQTPLSGMNASPSLVPDLPKHKPIYGIISPPPMLVFKHMPKLPLVSGIPVAQHPLVIPEEVPDLPDVSFEPTAPPPELVFLPAPELPLVSGKPVAQHPLVIPEEVPDLPDVSFEPTAPPPELVFLPAPELPLVSGKPVAQHPLVMPEEVPDLPDVSSEPASPPPFVEFLKLLKGTPPRNSDFALHPPLPKQIIIESGEKPPAIDFTITGSSLSGDPIESELMFEAPPTDIKVPPDSAKYSIYLCTPSDAVSKEVILALQEVLLLQESTSNDLLRDCPSWIASFQSIEKAREIAGKLEKRGATVFLDSRDIRHVCK